MLLWFFLKNFKDKKFKIGEFCFTPTLVFIAIFIVTTGIELAAGLLINMVFKETLWDYSHMFLTTKAQ